MMEQNDQSNCQQIEPLSLAKIFPQQTQSNLLLSSQLPIPEVIEMLKNLAACNEKIYKWEQSKLRLQTIPESDTNKRQLMEIIN